MAGGAGMAGGARASGALIGAVAYLLAWGVMMTAMMLPSATPMVALYGAIHRHAGESGQHGIATGLFALLYLLAWLVVGIPVYAAGQAVDALTAARPVLAGLLPYGLALVLIVAGAYQFSPLKETCLRACQSPLGFLMARWRPGYAGTIRLGIAHALYCIGCCWALMVVLVAAGAMGLHWVLLIAVVVAAEKLAPWGWWVARFAGAALVALGLLVAIQPGMYAILRTGGVAMGM
ncbi:MAG: DUF2182 domain-containing protein [Chloroflexi bacterium]|nr:DUF2182 domain-containing protein [Chloroflexota bacterium]